MKLQPRPRGQSVLTPGLITTVGLTGLFIRISLLALIVAGQAAFGDLEVGRSIFFMSFALCLIVAALECRSATDARHHRGAGAIECRKKRQSCC
jgi:Ca2+-transporting ATPase